MTAPKFAVMFERPYREIKHVWQGVSLIIGECASAYEEEPEFSRQLKILFAEYC